MFTLDQYLTCAGTCYTTTLDEDLLINANATVSYVNAFMAEMSELRGPFKQPVITSGYRTEAYNLSLSTRGYHPALKSKHVQAQAVDLADHDGMIDSFCMDFPGMLEHHTLWFEHPASTKGWCHLQIVPYASFRPNRPRWFYP